jgi:hypothetical protein
MVGKIVMNEQTKTMKNAWFKRAGWFYFPVALPGAVLTVMALIFSVQVFIAIDRHSHSVSDTFYGIFPYFACCFLLMNWIASNTSSEKSPATKTDAPLVQ